MEQVWFNFWTGVLGPFESIAAGRLALTRMMTNRLCP
jgi:putative sterol carrier protein